MPDIPIDLTSDQFRQLGYRAVDMIAALLDRLPDAPSRMFLPPEHRQRLLEQPAPDQPSAPEALLAAIERDVLPYPMGSISPRFFAWVNSPSAPLGVLADMLAAALNSSAAGGDHSATYIEHAALGWLKAWLGYPETSGGILCSGGSVANLIGLTVMRHVKTAGTVRADGLYHQHGAPMVIYTSAQGHSCIQKAVELLGLGSAYLRRIRTDSEYRLDVAALRDQIRADKDAGLHPVCVAASAGTVNTGAVDPLDALADVCDEHDLWFHVDGAYGGVGVLAEQTGGLDGLYKGMERADSLAVDPHKWLYVPIECGCALVRDKEAMRAAFSLVPPYLRDDTDLPWFSEFGIQQTRGFRALKLWVVMQQVGLSGYRELISRDVALARALQAKIRARADFELVAAGPLSITCFRCLPPGVSDPAQIDAINRAAVAAVQAEGEVFLTSTELAGRPVLRACIVNFRTQDADLDRLLDCVARATQRVLERRESVI